MVRHRCTRCKEDVGAFGIRHKYAGGLFCEDCLRSLRYAGPRHIPSFWGGFWGRIWDWVKDIVVSPFKPKPESKEKAMRVAYSVIKSKARGILPDARIMSPQKR